MLKMLKISYFQRVNENSLKILNEYMQCGEQERKILSNNPLKFYQRVHKTSGFPKSRDGTIVIFEKQCRSTTRYSKLNMVYV